MPDRLRFESLLADLSSRFINIPADQIESQIEWGLRQIVEVLGIDRVGLGEASPDHSQLLITHSYEVPGVPPSPRVIMEQQFPWYAGRVRLGEPLRLGRLPDDFPPEAVPEREYCAHFGMKSLLMVPFKVAGTVVGGIGFETFKDYRDWPDEIVPRLGLIGDIFAHALARKRADEALRLAEEQARQLRDALAHAGRLELVSHLTMSIAHEVNQPLCAISSNAQTAIDLLEIGDKDELQLALRDISTDARRGSEVVARIRDMLKKVESCRLPVGIASVVGEISSVLHREASAKGVGLTLETETSDLVVLCDRVQIQQVVLNLVLNAIEAVVSMSDSGPREVAIRVTRDAEQRAQVSVQDDGIGLSAEECERVFVPFVTSKAKGLGMGLAISRSIVQSHGGKLWATPRPERGTTFHFRLPAVDVSES